MIRFLSAVTCVVMLNANVYESLGQPSYTVKGLRQRPSGSNSATGSTLQKRSKETTTVSVELLQMKPGPNPSVFKWQHTFAEQKVSVRIRAGKKSEQPMITEQKLGVLRQIKVVGLIDTTGRIIFPKNQVFTLADGAKLGVWLEELKTYGEQGSPKGQPVWGLTKTQFETVYNALSGTVDSEVTGLRLDAALMKLQLPTKHPSKMTEQAVAWLKTEYADSPPVKSTLKGFAKGTAFAILLNEYGLGFHPLRKPDGSIELLVEPLKVTRETWPIGWDLKESRLKTARKLFLDYVPIDLENVRFLDVLNAVSVKAEIPILVDRYRIEGFGIDVESLRINYRSKRTSWFRLLGGITTPNRMTRRERIDEAGRAFVWVTFLQPGTTD
ncbi:MAG: hypothetical protein O3A00_11245 [Planctomycetota bacterium]|nr:hypothetical protein [Planctomycetota bacterium]